MQAPKKEALDAPVAYEANDSLVFTQGGFAHLYGQGKVTYPGADLEADIISMDMDNSTVFARGVADSLGTVKGRPVFKDGDTSYETDTIRYNFKSKRGIISNVVSQQGEGYVTGHNAKKGNGDELYMKSGRYTTCDHHDHPLFYMQMTYAKVRPRDVVTGRPTRGGRRSAAAGTSFLLLPLFQQLSVGFPDADLYGRLQPRLRPDRRRLLLCHQ